ncbi:hypothetical protein Pan216_39750 [Planctomycetes bacterium Pan216]|uniref:Blue (type 1) copper domain-containing protein n=1 Tax=Kolteria novifilia TaxID=2527975 RepID=A0A518B7Z8_9BACT|nr:hypothetical protein Pan216_39750 [Planctomycetes bacterium Pan216]
MRMRVPGNLLLGLGVCALVVGCGGEETPRRRVVAQQGSPAGGAPGAAPTTAAPAAAPAGDAAGDAAAGWGTIKGRLVWGKPELPKMPDLDVNKDKEWCLKEGALKAETVVVDPETKGIKNVFVYVRKPSGVHPDMPKDAAAVKAAYEAAFKEKNGIPISELAKAVAEKKVKLADVKAPGMIDQVHCQYYPHAVAVREGQPTLVLNPEPIAHNVKVSSVSGKNEANPNMPPNTFQVFEWQEESQPLKIECSIHGWMNMYGMVFDHPYFIVTDKDGSFEIKNVPAGEVALVMRNPKYIDAKTGGKGSSRGAKIAVKPGETVDLGEIEVTGL